MEVKERILLKAADLYMRYGIRSITMDEIATQLGISKKTIYQFFTDKDDMVMAVIDQEIQKNETDCIQFRDHSENAVHQIFLALESLEEMLKYTNPLMLYDLEKHHPRSYKKLKEYKYQFLYQMIAENLQWGMTEGLYRSDIQRDIVSKARIESASAMSITADRIPGFAATTSSSNSFRRPAMITLFPSAPNASANARPIPEVPPVIRTVLSLIRTIASTRPR